MEKLAINEVFEQHQFIKATDKLDWIEYDNDPWMIPAIGLPGCIDIKNHSLLHLEMCKDAWLEAKNKCLNGVINKIRFHISARVNRPDTVLVCVSDLMQEFEFCQIPFVSNVEELIDGIR
jgi:hypothetical protein